MFHFTKPRYLSKWTDPATNQTCPAYQFDVHLPDTQSAAQEVGISFLLEADTPLTVNAVEDALRHERTWWCAVLQQFLTATASYFSRPYTVQHVERVVQHVEVAHASTEEDVSLPRRILCLPTMFHFSGGKLRVHWHATETPAGIDLPDEEESDVSVVPPVPVVPVVPVVPPVGSQGGDRLEEWDVEALPEEKDATGEAAAFAADPAMLLERQRVKEARLKAKLAAYRAQYEMSRFYDKYGNEVSDSEDEEEDDDEEEDEEDEDLFL